MISLNFARKFTFDYIWCWCWCWYKTTTKKRNETETERKPYNLTMVINIHKSFFTITFIKKLLLFHYFSKTEKEPLLFIFHVQTMDEHHWFRLICWWNHKRTESHSLTLTKQRRKEKKREREGVCSKCFSMVNEIYSIVQNRTMT